MGALLTVKQAAARLQCSPATVYQLCALKILPHSRVGLGRGVIRIAEGDIHAYLTSRRTEPEPIRLRHIN